MNMLVSHWSANPVVLAVYAVVAGAHLRGTRSLARGAGGAGGRPGHPGREAACFHAGLLVAAAALLSPVGYWAQHYMWVRSVQDLLLANVAAGLIVLGAPWLALREGLGLAGRWRLGRPVDADAAPAVARAWPRRALLIALAYNMAWCGWHLPAAYDAVLTHPPVYAAEVVSYLGLGTAFWLALIGSAPLAPRLAPLRRVVVLVGTVVVGALLGMVLAFGAHAAYPGYQAAHRAAGAVLADQQAAGAVLWVLMLPSYAIAVVALLIRWLSDEESDARSGLDRLLKPAKPAWPSRPGLR
jgi:putative membrane protein